MNISAEDFLKHMKEAVATAERIAQQRDEALARLAAVEAERDTAQAGEARVVEALRDFVMYAQGDLGSRNLDGPERHGLAEGYWDGVQAVVDRLQALIDSLSQPALDWLAQREREAAAKELERLAANHWLRQGLRDRAAVLRAGKEGE